tara:strand:- start:242 stop:517 length:276 start_codon:yes stop_codon:yes gene_type:complete
MTEKPFVHKKAFSNVKLNFMFHDEVAKTLVKLLDKKGIINLGGSTQTVYNFAKKNNEKVKKALMKNNTNEILPYNSSMNLSKLKKLIKKNT